MVYVSTACLKGKNARFEKDFYKVMDTYVKAGIRDIELGSAHDYISDLKKLFSLQKKYELNFIVHTFFPPLKEQLWVNIASQDAKVYKDSMFVAKNAIEFCRKADAPLYTIHPGYTKNVEPSDDFITKGKEMDYEKCFSRLIESVQLLADRAQAQGIKLGVEIQFNKIGFALCSNAEEFKRLFKEVTNKNLGILFDFGHAYSNAKHFKFDIKDLINAIKDKIIAFHIHKGSGNDEHGKVPNLEFFSDFDRSFFRDKFLTLEVNWLSIRDILEQKALIEQLPQPQDNET